MVRRMARLFIYILLKYANFLKYITVFLWFWLKIHKFAVDIIIFSLCLMAASPAKVLKINTTLQF